MCVCVFVCVCVGRCIAGGLLGLTRFVSWLSIMKLCTCRSARVSSIFLASTATTSAVQPEPCAHSHVPPAPGINPPRRQDPPAQEHVPLSHQCGDVNKVKTHRYKDKAQASAITIGTRSTLTKTTAWAATFLGAGGRSGRFHPAPQMGELTLMNHSLIHCWETTWHKNSSLTFKRLFCCN